MRKLLPLALIVLMIAAVFGCGKKVQKPGCPTNQVCTELFASVSVECVDKNGVLVNVKDVTVTNLRTDEVIVVHNTTVAPSISPHIITIATDNNRKQFSTEGDDVRVTATSLATNKTVTALFKISGGCNCHIDKISGPDKMVFE